MVTGFAGFVGAKGTIGVVEGTVTGVEAGLVGETVMMVGVSGGVITGEGGVGELVVSCRVLLMWTLLGFSLRNKGNISSPSSFLSSTKSLVVRTCA